MSGETAQILGLDSTLPRVNRGTAVQQIYDNVRHLIVDLTLEPGTVLSTKDLAGDFGTSLTPVREALILLEREGLVDVVPQSRTSVSLIDIQHARETHFLRLSVEIEVARELAQNIDAKGLAEISAWIDAQQREFDADDQTEFNRTDNGLHQTMFRQTGVEGLTKLLDTRRGHYDRIRRLYLRVQERREIVIQEHRAILAALENRDEVAAEAAVRQHLGKSLAIVDEIRQRHPGYFL